MTLQCRHSASYTVTANFLVPGNTSCWLTLQLFSSFCNSYVGLRGSRPTVSWGYMMLWLKISIYIRNIVLRTWSAKQCRIIHTHTYTKTIRALRTTTWHENDGPSKSWGVKMQDTKMQDPKIEDLKIEDLKLENYFVFSVTVKIFLGQIIDLLFTSQNLNRNLKHHRPLTMSWSTHSCTRSV